MIKMIHFLIINHLFNENNNDNKNKLYTKHKGIDIKLSKFNKFTNMKFTKENIKNSIFYL